MIVWKDVMRVANAYYRSGLYTQALAWYRQALQLAQQDEESQFLCSEQALTMVITSYLNIASTYVQLEQYKHAGVVYRNALDFITQIEPVFWSFKDIDLALKQEQRRILVEKRRYEILHGWSVRPLNVRSKEGGLLFPTNRQRQLIQRVCNVFSVPFSVPISVH